MTTPLLDRPMPIDDATRRQFLTGLAAAGLLTGCATDDPPTVVPATEPRTISHAFGATEVPATPQRIVTVGYVDQDAVLALGFVPIAVRDWVGERPPTDWPWQQSLVGDVKPEILPFELGLEQLAALEPDLILAIWAGITDAEYADLSRIAPTVAHEAAYAEDAFLAPWEERTRFTGRILGQADRADQLVVEVETRFAQARDRHPEFAGATFAIVDGPAEGQRLPLHPGQPARNRHRRTRFHGSGRDHRAHPGERDRGDQPGAVGAGRSGGGALDRHGRLPGPGDAALRAARRGVGGSRSVRRPLAEHRTVVRDGPEPELCPGPARTDARRRRRRDPATG